VPQIFQLFSYSCLPFERNPFAARGRDRASAITSGKLWHPEYHRRAVFLISNAVFSVNLVLRQFPRVPQHFVGRVAGHNVAEQVLCEENQAGPRHEGGKRALSPG